MTENSPQKELKLYKGNKLTNDYSNLQTSYIKQRFFLYYIKHESHCTLMDTIIKPMQLLSTVISYEQMCISKYLTSLQISQPVHILSCIINVGILHFPCLSFYHSLLRHGKNLTWLQCNKHACTTIYKIIFKLHYLMLIKMMMKNLKCVRNLHFKIAINLLIFAWVQMYLISDKYDIIFI